MNISRKKFLLNAALLTSSCMMNPYPKGPPKRIAKPVRSRVATLTQGPLNHFFGYYGISPWNESGQNLVCLQSSFQDHMPAPDEPAAIGLVAADTGKFTQITETHAWNFQQGAMLHWNPLRPESEIIYNERVENRIVSVVMDVNTGRKRELPRPVNAISHDGRFALSLTYGRLGRLRKVVGYAGIEDPNPNHPHPDNDGVFLLDLETGESKLVVSIARVYDIIKASHPELDNEHMWFNHTVFNRNDSRFFFLARTRIPGAGLETGMFTANLDGSELRQVIPYGSSVSHFDWRNDREIIATFKLSGDKRVHVLFTDGEADYQHLGGGCLDYDGHCSFSPDQQWLVTDRKYTQKLQQSLIVYHVPSGECHTVTTLDMTARRYISGDLRCDFHPRWNRGGNAICFDAISSADGTRQLHIAYLEFV